VNNTGTKKFSIIK